MLGMFQMSETQTQPCAVSAQAVKVDCRMDHGNVCPQRRQVFSTLFLTRNLGRIEMQMMADVGLEGSFVRL